MTHEAYSGPQCPLPTPAQDTVQMGHGGGGSLMQGLLERLFLPAFDNPALDERHDGAVLDRPGGRIAFTTDAYVVHPPVFPGGDIGSLAVHGTLNDLAMCGARPIALSAAFVLEEGFPFAILDTLTASMARAAKEAGAPIVTGDTKVVDRGKADGIFVVTAGVGQVPAGVTIAPSRIQPGDAIVVSGDIGRHGTAILAVRQGLAFDTTLKSDCASLVPAVRALTDADIDIHCLRDCTRGGMATAVIELARDSRRAITLDEESIPVDEAVRGACELLGLDPLYVANEGRFIAVVPAGQADRALAALREVPVSAGARVAGRVDDHPAGRVVLDSRLGTQRILDLLSGEQLPRIC